MTLRNLPDHERLERWCYPMGRPPVPSAEDRALATQQVDADFSDRSESWLANNRDDLIRQYAVGNMQMRRARQSEVSSERRDVAA